MRRAYIELIWRYCVDFLPLGADNWMWNVNWCEGANPTVTTLEHPPHKSLSTPFYCSTPCLLSTPSYTPSTPLSSIQLLPPPKKSPPLSSHPLFLVLSYLSFSRPLIPFFFLSSFVTIRQHREEVKVLKSKVSLTSNPTRTPNPNSNSNQISRLETL